MVEVFSKAKAIAFSMAIDSTIQAKQQPMASWEVNSTPG